MIIPLQITFRGMTPSPAAESRIREEARALERYHPHINGCRIVVEKNHHHGRKGQPFHVRIDLTVTGGEIVISREPVERHAHADLFVAIRDAFDEAARRLEDHVRRKRLDTKSHDVPAHGRIIKISPPEDYGFIRTPEERDVYFHRESVVGKDFEHLEVGDEVRFVLHEADAEHEPGPHASSVRTIGKHHLSPRG